MSSSHPVGVEICPSPAGHFRTFDVFDTVLTRTVGDPAVLAEHLGRRMRDEGLVACEPTVVAAVRRRAEEWLGGRLGRDPRLIEIHREIARSLGLPGGTAGRSHEMELEIERSVSHVVPGAVERVGRARERSANGRVGYLSDTALPSTALITMLSRAGLWRDGDLCVCSAEAGADKHSGRMYPMVAAELGVAPGNILHVGDDVWNDVAMARFHGFRAAPAPAARRNRYETALDADSAAGGGLTAWLSGASRLSRLDATERGMRPELAAVAAGVFAPLLVGFSLWLVGQTRTRGLRRLYFVSRDGALLMRVARPILARLVPEVECRYLYGSRRAWNLASSGLDAGRGDAEWLTGPLDTEATARQLLERVGLTVSEAAAVLPLPAFSVDRVLSRDDRDSVVAAIESGPLADLVRARADGERALVVDYLRQEGLGADVPSAVVDIGWMGRSTRSLDEIRAWAGLPELDYLFLGLNPGADAYSGPRVAARHAAWLYDHDEGHGVPGPLPSGHVLMMEAMTAGTEGSTVGYRRDGERIVPVLASPENTEALEWGLAQVQDVVLDTARRWAAVAPLHWQVDLRAACLAVLTAFWDRPTAGEVAAWADFPHDDVGAGSVPLARPVATRFALAQLRAGHVRFRPVDSWRAGTTALSSLPWRMVLTAKWAQEQHGVRLRRVPRRLRIELARRRRPGRER